MNSVHVHWSPGVTLEMLERGAIEKAFNYYKRNKTATAAALGISIRTLDERLKKYEQDDTSLKARMDAQAKRDLDFHYRSRGLRPPEAEVQSEAMVEESAADDADTGSGSADTGSGSADLGSDSEGDAAEIGEEGAQDGEHGDGSPSGDEVESAPAVSTESPLSLHVGKKVQGMSSRKSSSRRGRR